MVANPHHGPRTNRVQPLAVAPQTAESLHITITHLHSRRNPRRTGGRNDPRRLVRRNHHGVVWPCLGMILTGHQRNPQPLDAAAVAELLLILLDVLPDHALAPNITPNWDGGAMATWLLGGLTLEIETRPGQPAQYCYGDERGQQDLDDEGDVSGNKERLRRWAKVLADAAAELGL